MGAPKGNKNARRMGGVRVNKDGYLQITCGPMRGKYVHRLVAEAKLGRPLLPNEEAHHVDHDRLNPAPDNMAVINIAEHRRESAFWRWRYRG